MRVDQASVSQGVAALRPFDFEAMPVVQTRLRRTGEDSWEEEAFEPVRFVPLLPGRAGGGTLPEQIADLAEPFDDHAELARLADRFGGRRVVCLGESTHGTAEF